MTMDPIFVLLSPQLLREIPGGVGPMFFRGYDVFFSIADKACSFVFHGMSVRVEIVRLLTMMSCRTTSCILFFVMKVIAMLVSMLRVIILLSAEEVE